MIAGLAEAEREAAFSQLLIVSGLRHLEEEVEQEARKMPILNDILDHKVLGREYKRGLQEGRQEGRQEIALAIVRRQLEKRFGPLPAWAEERLAAYPTPGLEELAVHAFDCESLEGLLK